MSAGNCSVCDENVCEHMLAKIRTLEAELAAERVNHEETLAMWRKYDVLLQRIHDRLGIPGGDEDSILPALEALMVGPSVSPKGPGSEPK